MLTWPHLKLMLCGDSLDDASNPWPDDDHLLAGCIINT